MIDKYILDTNVFVYLFDKNHRKKNQKAQELVCKFIENSNYFISTQVIGELINVLTKKHKESVTPKDIRIFIEAIPSEKILILNIDDYSKALLIHHKYKYSFWDSLILAAGLNNSCTYVLSEDMQHLQKIDTLTIVNPFKDYAL